MSAADYQLAWIIYGVAALFGIAASFYFTRWMWRYLREPLRVLIAVALLVPAVVVSEPTALYAPAAITAAIEFFLNHQLASDALSVLATYAAIALGVYVAFAVLRIYWRKRASQAQRVHAEPSLEEAADNESGVYEQALESFMVAAKDRVLPSVKPRKAPSELTLAERLRAEQGQRIEPSLSGIEAVKEK